MVTSTLAPLDVLGMTPAFFHLPCVVAGLETLDYFLLTSGDPRTIQQASYWDLVAIGTLPRDPNGVVLRQIHIEEEALDWTPFDAWTDGMGSFALNPPEVAALHDFLLSLAERLSEQSPTDDAVEHTYFALVSVDAYVECGIPAGLVERIRKLLERDTCLYRYQPDATLTLSPACRFLQLSEWTAPWRQHPLSATVSVGLQTYTPTHIAHIQKAYAGYLGEQATAPALPADMLDGESGLQCSTGALRALARLLQQRLDMVAWRADTR
jgi:hypothetical protein